MWTMNTLGIVRERHHHLLSNSPMGPLESKMMFKFQCKPLCLLQQLQQLDWQGMCSRQEQKSPVEFLSLYSNPVSAIPGKVPLDPVIWQPWPIISKDFFSFKHLRKCWINCALGDGEFWPNAIWNDWLSSRTLLSSVHYRYISKYEMKIFFRISLPVFFTPGRYSEMFTFIL